MSKGPYDAHAPAYALARVPHADIRAELEKIGLPHPASCVLDIGCGSLRETAHVAAVARRFVGIDQSAGMLSAAPPTSAELIISDMDALLPVEPGTFSHALLVSSIHHSRDPFTLMRSISTVCRRSDARVLIVTHAPVQVLQRPTYRFFPGLAERSAARFPDPSRLEAALRGLGFQVEIDELARPSVPMDAAFLARLSKRAFDSAFFLISDDEWHAGLDRMKREIAPSESYPRARVVLRAAR